MNCPITDRIASNTKDVNTKLSMLLRQKMFSTDMRERILIQKQIDDLKKLL